MTEDLFFDEAINLGCKLSHYILPKYLKNLTIVDAGANVGRSIESLRCMGIRNRIIAIEPCVSNVNALRQKILKDVEIIPRALVGLNEPKTVSFTEIESLSEWGSVTDINSNRGRSIGKKHIKYVVETMTLDSIIGDGVDYLKMDIEGSEIGVILTMSQDLSRRIRQISLEIHSKNERLIIDKMQELGYITKWYEKDMEIFGVRKDILGTL